jgi:hypothetical protein
LLLALGMLAEVGRLKLPPSLKSRFQAQFQNALAAPTDALALVQALDYLVTLAKEKVKYPGSAGHAKKVLDRLKAASGHRFSEIQFEKICAALLQLGKRPLMRQFAVFGMRAYPNGPFFRYALAEYLLGNGRPSANKTFRAERFLAHAESLTAALPREDPRRELYLAMIRERRAMISARDSLTQIVYRFAGDSDADFDDF